LYPFFNLNLFAFEYSWKFSTIKKRKLECLFCCSQFFCSLLCYIFCLMCVKQSKFCLYSCINCYLPIFISPVSGLRSGHTGHFAKWFVLTD